VDDVAAAVALGIRVGEYAAAVRSGSNQSRARFAAHQTTESAVQRAARELFTKSPAGVCAVFVLFMNCVNDVTLLVQVLAGTLFCTKACSWVLVMTLHSALAVKLLATSNY
jgi:hypothetical protein